MRNVAWMGALVAVLALGGCGDDGGEAPTPGVAVNQLATPRQSIARQVALLKKGDLENFKACFTRRLHKRITKDAMAKGAAEVGGMSLAELFGRAEEGTYEGQPTAKVMMKNGRTLTTLVQVDGRWLADTIWFR